MQIRKIAWLAAFALLIITLSTGTLYSWQAFADYLQHRDPLHVIKVLKEITPAVNP